MEFPSRKSRISLGPANFRPSGRRTLRAFGRTIDRIRERNFATVRQPWCDDQECGCRRARSMASGRCRSGLRSVAAGDVQHIARFVHDGPMPDPLRDDAGAATAQFDRPLAGRFFQNSDRPRSPAEIRSRRRRDGLPKSASWCRCDAVRRGGRRQGRCSPRWSVRNPVRPTELSPPRYPTDGHRLSPD
jgi:hypothetical protein